MVCTHMKQASIQARTLMHCVQHNHKPGRQRQAGVYRAFLNRPERPSSSGKTVGKQRFLEPNLLQIRATVLVIAPKPLILSGFSGSAAQK